MTRPMTRRIALAAGAVALVFASYRVHVHADEPILRAAPIVGYDGPRSARVWVAPVDTRATVVVAFVASRSSRGREEERVTFPPVVPPALSTKVRIDGLEPSTTYSYRILVNGREDQDARGSFETGPLPGEPVQATIGVTSCMHVYRYPHQVAWNAMAAEKPRLLVQLGDNVYANSTNRSILHDWYLKQRRVPEYVRVLRTLSLLATWDDHDFGANDSDGSLAGKEESLEVFRELWPNPSFGSSEEPGVYFKTSYGDVDLFVLDGRYERSSDMAPESDSKRMLGPRQWAWLERGLRESKATFKLVASGSTIEASFKDYWGLYPRERDRLYRITQDMTGIVFLTGDVHRSLVLKTKSEVAGYPIYEVVSSGIAVEEGPFSFVSMDIDTKKEDPTITCHVVKVAPTGETIERKKRTIHASELRAPF